MNDNIKETVDELIPQLNVNLPSKDSSEENSSLIQDAELLNVYSEALNKIRDDRFEIDQILSNMVEMVINGGDSSTSSKEAMVNLLKLKSDTVDKMAKIAELMTRVKLKEKDTFPRYLAAHQNNTINIGKNQSRKALIQEINRAKKEKGKIQDE